MKKRKRFLTDDQIFLPFLLIWCIVPVGWLLTRHYAKCQPSLSLSTCDASGVLFFALVAAVIGIVFLRSKKISLSKSTEIAVLAAIYTIGVMIILGIFGVISFLHPFLTAIAIPLIAAELGLLLYQRKS